MIGFADPSIDRLTLDHRLEVNTFTGSASLTVPIRASKGRGGFEPSLSLVYGLGGPNSTFGLGWNLAGLASIAVDTSRHDPRYEAGEDRYTLGGGAALVAVRRQGAGGVWEPVSEMRGAFRVERYRARTERSFEKFERWVDPASGRVHWRAYGRNGSVSIFGQAADNSTRIADPQDPDRRTFLWLLEAQYDRRGNAIRCEYKPEDAAEVSAAQAFEARRLRGAAGHAQRYLKRIRYGNSKPLSADQPAAVGNQWHFELVFDFGEHAGPVPDYAEQVPWPVRRDPFGTHRPGFELRTWRLCRRILMFHRFAELGGDPCLVGATELEHHEDEAGTTLQALRYRGYRKDLNSGDFASRPTAALTARYSEAQIASGFEAMETTANLPVGIDGAAYQWIDLDNEGLPGILHRQGQAWYYKENLGGGRFAPARPVEQVPAAVSASFQLYDHDGDGQINLISFEGREAGGYARDREAGRWGGYQTLRKLPRIDLANARVQWADLNGDGYPDLLIDRQDVIVWYPSDGRDAFADPVELARPDSRAGGPPTLQAAARLNTFFADMTGDGRPDMVRIDNGRVEYWPHLGGARFGPGVVMEGAPQIDDFGAFDPLRLRLADLGSGGGAGLLYLGRGALRLWTNRHGNSFEPEQRIGSLPYIDNLSSAQVFDLLGDGSRCLVWSSPLPSSQGQAVSYLRLTGSVPARLLLSLDNGTGAETRLGYRSSAQDYLRDKVRGQPWQTRLPHHRMVVESIAGHEAISGLTMVTRYDYRDGYFDNAERSFTGFGQVDTYDTDLARAGGEAEPAENTPPSLQRTWYHTGAATGSTERAAEFYRGDAQAGRLPPPLLEAVETLTTDEQFDGLRALAGTLWRQELFALRADGTRAVHPLRVSEFAYRIRRLQPTIAGRDAVFAFIQSEAAAYDYDEDPSDPRIKHDLVAQHDAVGNVQARLSLAYPRRANAPEIEPGQHHLHATLIEKSFRNFDEAGRFELGIETEERHQVLSGLPAPVGDLFDRAALLAHLAAALADRLDFHEEPDGVLPQARLIAWQRNRFWNDARNAVLPPGQIGTIGLLNSIERAVLADAGVADAFGGRVDAAMLSGEARLRLADGYWWATDTRYAYDGPGRFFRLAEETSPGGARQRHTLDQHALLVTAVEDVFGNRITGQPDYQVLASAVVTDANGNVSETRYDPLGIGFVTVVRGEQLGDDGQAHPVGAEPLAAYAPQAGFGFAEILADPARFLQRASRFLHYDVEAFAAGDGPVRTILLERERHFHDGEGANAAASPIRITLSYLDGLLRPVQTKVGAGPGPAVQRGADGTVVLDSGGRPVLADAAERWLTQGHAVFNNKGWLVRRHEPFFSDRPGYETDQALRRLGAATRTSYDPVGRVLRQDYPDGSFASYAYSPWQLRSSDANDNVEGSAYEGARLALPLNDPERDALEKSRAHARTPTIVANDPVGREIVIRQLGAGGSELRSEVEFGVLGLPVRMIDQRGLLAFVYRHDMLGRTLFADSMDAGQSRSLFDTHGRLIRHWDPRGHVHSYAFDANGRPVATRVTGPGGLDHVTERLRYGDDPAVPQAALRNLRGRLVEHQDAAGTVLIGRCHMDGQALRKERRLCAAADAHQTVTDWTDPAQVALQAERFGSRQWLDALGRPLRQVLPDGTTREYAYAALGHLDTVRLTSADGVINQQVIASAIAVNAHGQYARLVHGNGVETLYDHDAKTWRLARLRTRRVAGDGRVFQDIAYAYDPVGNITGYHDAIQDPGAAAPIAGLTVSPACDFTYDPHYRLVRATGRVHQALLEHDYRGDRPDPDAVKSTRHIGLNNGAAVERYTRIYDYDAAGNFVRLRHQGASHSWTTDYWTSAQSNRTLPRKDLNGIDLADPEAHFDAAGNTVRLPHLRTMDWNHEGRLVRAVVIDRSGGGQADDAEYYVYGGDGRRIRRVGERLVGGTVERTETLFLDGCEIRRITHGGALRLERLTSHVADEGRRLATLHQWTIDSAGRETDDPAAKKLHYQVGNHLGSVSLELDQAGAVISYEEYFPYGGTSFIAGRSIREIRLKDLRYCGKCRDDMTGLYCYEFRYYAPFIGNWLSPDPLGPADGLNLYRFVHNNPIVFIDPLGLETLQQLTSVKPGLSEAEAISQANWNWAYAQGIRITDIRPASAAEQKLGAEWVIVTTVRLSAKERDDIERLQILGPELADMLMSLDDGPGLGGSLEKPAGEGEGGGKDEGAKDGDGEDGKGDGGAADAGAGKGAGQQGKGPGGGGEDAAGAKGAGKGSGTGDGEGSGKDKGGKGKPGAEAEGGSKTGAKDGSKDGVEGAKGTKDGAKGEPGKAGSGTEPGGKGTIAPPPGFATGPDGVPYTPDMKLPEVTPEGGTPTTDPGQVRPGVAGGDPRGQPGSEAGSGTSPDGVKGGARDGTPGTGGTGSGGGPGDSENGRASGEAGGNDGGIIGGQGWLSLPSWLASPINTVIEHGETILDVVQVGLDVVGLIPGLGEIADGINGLISLARGDYAGAALSFAAMIPFAGWAATAGKLGGKAFKAAGAIGGVAGTVAKHGDEAAGLGKAILHNGDEAAKAVTKSADEVAMAPVAGAAGGKKKLLPGEGDVGTYDDLVAAGSKGDNITPHHIPSANRMAKEGVAKADGISINMEHPHPGTGGRHRATFTYGSQADLNMSPRDALAAGVRDLRKIYQADGLYSPQIRDALIELIRQNKTTFPTIFAK